MSTISVTNTLVNGTIPDASLWNTNYSDLVNGHNNHDAGTSIWTIVNGALFKRSGDTIYTIQQVVTATSTTAFTTTSSTYQTSNLSASITPTSATSKILIIASGRCHTASNADSGVYVSLFRGGTDLGAGSGGFYLTGGSATGTVSASGALSIYDSPATTSSTTYSVKIKNDNNSTTIGYGAASNTQSITLMEIR